MENWDFTCNLIVSFQTKRKLETLLFKLVVKSNWTMSCTVLLVLPMLGLRCCLDVDQSREYTRGCEIYDIPFMWLQVVICYVIQFEIMFMRFVLVELLCVLRFSVIHLIIRLSVKEPSWSLWVLWYGTEQCFMCLWEVV